MSRPKKATACCGNAPITKHQSILIAAQEVFLEGGYAAASMDAVAARANVSKATIYAHFENKRALFEAMISARCEATFSDLGMPGNHNDARQALLEVALHFLHLITAPEALAIHRVVMAEAPRLPEVGEAFYAAGPIRAHARIGNLFNDLTRRSLLAMPEADVALATDLFFGMLKGDIHTRALLHLPPCAHDIDGLAKGAVEMLMARYGVKAET